MKNINATEDKVGSEALRHHYILKEEKWTKVTNGDANGNTNVKFGVSFACLSDQKSYYDKFINGILRYFQLAFKEKYLYEYIKLDYFNNPNQYQFYKENSSSFEISLNNMLADIKRVISEYSNEIENKTLKESKNIMRRDIYRSISQN